MNEVIRIGDFVCDCGAMAPSSLRVKGFKQRSQIVFPYEGGSKFIEGKIRLSRPDFYYINKQIVVFSESADFSTGGLILAFSYDDRRLGFVEVEIE